MKLLEQSLAICALVAFAPLSGVTGYLVHALRQDSSEMRVSRVIPLDYFLETKSFSEIENTKALLEALAAHSISEMRTRSAARGHVRTDGLAAPALAALRDVEKRIEEFSGTEQELLLVKEQLILLFQAGLHDRWLDVYLATLYEHPTHDLVGRCAQRAVTVAREIGREDALMAGFRHISSIPLEFNSKPIVQATVMQTTVARHSPPADEDKLL
ncbi:MAG: hypothetical protein L0Z50_36900 [Verrucomicrobiales bacterium]|nr:hypothetical protein [Verrucomicrobiales bacterium]